MKTCESEQWSRQVTTGGAFFPMGSTADQIRENFRKFKNIEILAKNIGSRLAGLFFVSLLRTSHAAPEARHLAPGTSHLTLSAMHLNPATAVIPRKAIDQKTGLPGATRVGTARAGA